MKSTEKRTPFIFGALPHSVLDLANRLQATASKLLLYLARRTLSFRKGSIVMSYRDISQAIGVCWRTVARAAKDLSKQGFVVREKMKNGTYKWWVPLRPDEVVGKPDGNFLVKEVTPPPHDTGVISPMTSVSYPPMTSVSWDQMFGRELSKPENTRDEALSFSVEKGALKKDLFKETHVKKQHPCGERDGLAREAPIEVEAPVSAENPKLAPRRGDDEPLFKFCLRELIRYGVSLRMARKLCREHDHDLVKQVLETVPELSGVENVAGYLVTAIRDGGYSSCTSVPLDGRRQQVGAAALDKISQLAGQKNGHQVSGGRSTSRRRYGAERSLCESGVGEAPIVYRSVEETRREQESLERRRLEREKQYQDRAQTLAERFRALSADVKARLKALGEIRLEEMLPMSAKRDEMRRDPAFRKIANRSVLETFFERLELGLGEREALAAL